MRVRVSIRALLRLSTAICALSASPVLAQVIGQGTPPPVRIPLDDNGVDVLRGTYAIDAVDVAIGPNEKDGVVYRRINGANSTAASIEMVNDNFVVTINGKSSSFSSSYVSIEGDGSTLSQSGVNLIFTITVTLYLTPKLRVGLGLT